MSKTLIRDAGDIAEEFKGLTLEEFKKKLTEKFYVTYGRYENVSGRLFVELFHSGENADGEPAEGSVVWRAGEEGKDVKEEILDRIAAIKRYNKMIEGGYTRTFAGITQSDIDKGNAERLASRGALARENLLGEYYKGKSFFRIAEYTKDLYSIERGYDNMITGCQHELTESQTRVELDFALAEGFAREGEESDVVNLNPLAAFGIEGLAENNEMEEAEAKPKEGEFQLDWFTKMRSND